MTNQYTIREKENERVVFLHIAHGKALHFINLDIGHGPMKAYINNAYKDLLRAIDEGDAAKSYIASLDLCATLTHYACEYGERQKAVNPTEGK